MFYMEGYIFLEFSNHQNAAEAVAATNNLKLDKQHTFTVNLFSGKILPISLPGCDIKNIGKYSGNRVDILSKSSYTK